MRFVETEIAGVYVIELERAEDERGWFARTWCSDEFGRAGLPTDLVQISLSHTKRRGTIRGLHWQREPHAEGKLVRCVRGAIWDVAVDLRPESASRLGHVAVRLDARDGRALFIPKGCAHGFQTLEDDVDVLYHMDAPYEPAAARGARWDDPAFDIAWPLSEPTLHPRDASWPDYRALA